MPSNWLMKVDKPDDIDILKYVGRRVMVEADNGNHRIVEIKRIVGSLPHPTRFQIDDEDGDSHTISMLDFFAQMNGEKVTPEEIRAFEETTFDVRRR